MTQDILKEMGLTKARLLVIISSFRDEDFNKIPFEGSWTAAQVSEHILKSVSGVLELLCEPGLPTARNPNEKAGAIKAMFLDFTTKMQSPEFVLPGDLPIEKEKIYALLQDTLTKIAKTITTLELSEICKVFELPGFGEFTRAEWVWFAIYHTQRHTRQLKNIHSTIANRKQPANSSLD